MNELLTHGVQGEIAYENRVLREKVLVNITVPPTRSRTVGEVLDFHFGKRVVRPLIYIPGSCLGERWPEPGLRSKIKARPAARLDLCKAVSAQFEVVDLASDLLGHDASYLSHEDVMAGLLVQDKIVSLDQFGLAFNRIYWKHPRKVFPLDRITRVMALVEIDCGEDENSGIPAVITVDLVRRKSGDQPFEQYMFGLRDAIEPAYVQYVFVPCSS